jgi:hypothetical protein
MMPDLDPRAERRKKRGRASALISTTAILFVALAPPGWTWVGTDPKGWVLLAVSTVVGVAIALSADLPDRRRRDGRRNGSGATGRGDDRDDPAAAGAARRWRWRALAVASRLMPRSAGRRWRAEAESVLSEIAPSRRGAAIRSYLLSAPGLIVAMWARAAQRRARLGPRRPG